MRYLTLALALLLSTPSFGMGTPPPAPVPAAPVLASASACKLACWLPIIAVAGLFIYLAYTHNEWCEQNPGKCDR
jgi:hypothetical protein